jgi:hypothetical protein
MIARDVLIASTPLRAGEELRVMLSPYRGQCYLHCRRWYQDTGVWKPGKGLAVRVDMLPFLLHALHVTESSALEEGLLFSEDYSNLNLPAPVQVAP